MKKVVIVLVILLLAGIVLLVGFGGLDLVLPGKRSIRSQALSFMEDLRFKDYDGTARYHAPEDRERVDIPYLIQRMFKVKPELLDIMEYRVLSADIDSTGKRARTLVWSKVKLLNQNQIREPEVILYWRRHDDGTWYMRLEDSLRKVEERDPKKKH